MSKASQNANAVVNSVIQVADLYKVKSFRMQSRVMTVPGAAGRDRPMFFGQWVDDAGEKHYSGMADLLLRPRIWYLNPEGWEKDDGEYITQLLWVECKSGKGKMTHDQEAFRHHVTQNGEHHLHIHDDLRPLMAWFEEHGIKEGGRR